MAGTSALTIGGLYWLIDDASSSWSIPTALVGAGATVGGIALMRTSRSSLSLEERPLSNEPKRILSLRGQF